MDAVNEERSALGGWIAVRWDVDDGHKSFVGGA